jgi:hypothetical protein
MKIQISHQSHLEIDYLKNIPSRTESALEDLQAALGHMYDAQGALGYTNGIVPNMPAFIYKQMREQVAHLSYKMEQVQDALNQKVAENFTDDTEQQVIDFHPQGSHIEDHYIMANKGETV